MRFVVKVKTRINYNRGISRGIIVFRFVLSIRYGKTDITSDFVVGIIKRDVCTTIDLHCDVAYHAPMFFTYYMPVINYTVIFFTIC